MPCVHPVTWFAYASLPYHAGFPERPQVLGVSLLTFNLDLPSATRRALGALTKRGVRGSLATFGHVAAGALSAFAGRNLPVLLMYLPVHTFCSLVGLSFAFLSPKAATALWLGLMVPYYLMTQQVRGIAGLPLRCISRYQHLVSMCLC